MGAYTPSGRQAHHASPLRRALITGGGGFLGFHLATRLIQEEPGVEVLLLDLAPPRHPLPPGVRFIRGSVADATAVNAAVAGRCSGGGNGSSSGRTGDCCGGTDGSRDADRDPAGGGGSNNGSGPGGGDSGGGGSGEEGKGRPVDAVFHVASYGMSGRELRQTALIQAVNVDGTANVLDACVRHGVSRLVYVSTCNVIFVGREIVGGNESAPYPPTSAYKDTYSSTKAAAEKLVRAANGTALRPHCRSGAVYGADTSGNGQQQAAAPDGKGQRKGGMGQQQAVDEGQKQWEGRRREGGEEEVEGAGEDCRSTQMDGVGRKEGREEAWEESGARGVLSTCCVRSTGIWGPGETRHQPRVIRMVRAGLFAATFGDRASLSDWIHVGNLVQVLLRAERALRPPHRPAAGQVYYASDGAPINNLEHFRPFIEGLGYHYPKLNMPYGLVYGIAAAIEYGWPLLQYIVQDPPLTRMEVDKCGVNHWFDISKARDELGYKPVVYDRQDVVWQMAAEGWAASAVGMGQRGRREVARFRLIAMTVAVVVVVMAVALAYEGRGSI